VLIGNNLVCARCKPLYVQKLREGVPSSSSALVYADIGTRFLAKLLDLLMLVYSGGRERTEQEYRDLLESADFSLARIIATSSTVSIIEAVPLNERMNAKSYHSYR